MSKSPDAFRTISEVADWLGVQAHVLRFWESKFSQVKPVKRAGGRRYYRPADMKLLGGIKKLLHDDGLTIKGVQKLLQEYGVAHVSEMSQGLDETASPDLDDGRTVVKFQEKPPRRPQAQQIDMDLGTSGDSAPLPDTSDLPAFLSETTPLMPSDADIESSIPASVEFLESPEQPDTTPAPEQVTPVSEDSVAATEVPTLEATTAPEPQTVGRVLTLLSGLTAISPAQLRAIQPIAQELRSWLEQRKTQIAG